MFGKRPTGNSPGLVDQRQALSARSPAPVAAAPPPAASPNAGRTPFPSAGLGAPIVSAPTTKPNVGGMPAAPPPPPPSAVDSRRSESYYEVKGTIFGALIEAIDLAQLAKLDADSAREEIRDIVNEIIAIKNIVMSISEQEDLLDDICNDVLGYGPLEPLLARDEIADIMVNGSGTVYIEVAGKIQKTGIRFRDNQQLLNICQRIVSQVGRRVDESSPICDARLPDGSRVNAIVPPLAIDGPALTIRKFKKDKLTLEQLVKYGSVSPEGADILKVIGRCRVNTLISGGTGSGKTTLLNCLTRYIDDDERIVTCEDAAELQLQQPHVVRLETRPPNLEGEGQITMRDLVRNCLRMRPERIIVGEVRGPEAFDLLQAMNTGHDGSMGTLHANTPREALSRFGIDDHHGRLLAAIAHHPRDDLRFRRRRGPGGALARRLAPHHAYHRSDGTGGRRHHHPGRLPLRHHGRGRAGQSRWSAPLDRHRSSEILGTRPLLRRGGAARRRARCSGKDRRKRESLKRGHEHLRTLFPGSGRGRRRRVGLCLSPFVGGEEDRKALGQRRARRADRGASRAYSAALAPRAGRGHPQAARGAEQESQARPAVQTARLRPDCVGRNAGS